MIPKYQRILFISLLVSIVLMASFLFYERKKAHARLAAAGDQTPIAAPIDAETESVMLSIANDNEGTVTQVTRDYALPKEPTVRARALLERLLEEYALPKSTHPIPAGAAVDDVFLLNLPLGMTNGLPNRSVALPELGQVQASLRTPGSSEDPDHTEQTGASGQMAVINLRGSFLDGHPSGIGVEMLTLESILGTLHANFPLVTEVRFLVDGQQRETLAGHIDLARTYPANFAETPVQAAGASAGAGSGGDK